jgi:hypothetical protein
LTFAAKDKSLPYYAPMKFLLLYFGLGIAALAALWLLFRKTGVDRKGLQALWGWSLMGDLGFILVPLLWPLFALASLLEYLHLRSKQKDTCDKADALKHAGKYSHLTMDELLTAQKEMMDQSKSKE